MNNFQLDNTSVYLGGQCRWDIVLSKKGDGELEISNFQLSPLSSLVPYNKLPDTTRINTNHSENLKEFYNSIKENFWWTDPDTESHCGYDDSCIRGASRLPSYSVYNRQFGYLQPVWLEYMSENSYLEFEFDTYIASQNTVPLDSSVVRLENIGSNYHDRFVKYFNDWLKYINIKSENGNNRVMNASFENHTAAIDGINITTGQRSGNISVDYLINNLLSNERPLMETDYMLSTLFKEHNIITSQLFNFNFCFNLEDILDPTLINIVGLNGVCVDCVVRVVDGESVTTLDRMRIHTNYEFIDKDTADIYTILDSLSIDHGQIIQTKDLIWVYGDNNPISNLNVLDYLRDYTDKSLKTKNKLTQPIIHWGYSNSISNTFNVYEGYNEIYNEIKSIESIESDNDKLKVNVENYSIKSTNGVNIIEFPSKFIEGNNNYTWVLPGKIIYVSSGSILGPYGDFSLYISEFINKYGVSIKSSYDYWCGKEIDNNTKVLLIIADGQDLYNNVINSLGVTIFDNFGYGFVGGGWVIVINKEDGITLQGLLNKPIDEYLHSILSNIKNAIAEGNPGNYIGFDKELGVGQDETGGQVYYKVNTIGTFPYRRDGNLRPFFVNSDNIKYRNYVYGLDDDCNIVKIDSPSNECAEWKWIGGKNSNLIIPNTIPFEWTKQASDPVTLKEHLFALFNAYGNNQEYVFNLYDIDFTYNYSDDIAEITYTGKLTLK